MLTHSKRNLCLILFAFSLFLAAEVFFVQTAAAAVFHLTPTNSKVTVGELVKVRLSIDTKGKAINNTEATIIFPADLLEVQSINIDNSILSLWIEQQNFSNTDGRMSFNGGIPTPGYTGADGEIFLITFKTKKSGAAIFSFSGAAIRENDGLGTNILTYQNFPQIDIVPTADQPGYFSSDQDSDNDGIPDQKEIELYGTDPNKADTDGDGYNDGSEIITGYSPTVKGQAVDLNFSKKYAGRILLQIQEHGEAWYIYPKNYRRYFLGRPADAFEIMRKLGLGISDSDLAKIPKNTETRQDKTGLAKKLSGYIVLQVQSHGEAWYINPVDNKRYYLGRPQDAFNLMKKLGLGISFNNLMKIQK